MELHEPASRSIALGSAFEITIGQSIIIGGYTLSAVHIPTVCQGTVRLRRPSGDFSLSSSPGHEELAFTLHGDWNFFCFTDIVVQLIWSKRNTARCVIWPTPPIAYRVAEEIVKWAAMEDGYIAKYGDENAVRIRSLILRHVDHREDKPIWEVSMAFPLSEGHIEAWQTAVIDGVSGAILGLAPRLKSHVPVSQHEGSN